MEIVINTFLGEASGFIDYKDVGAPLDTTCVVEEHDLFGCLGFILSALSEKKDITITWQEV